MESSPIRTVLREHRRAMVTYFSIAAVASPGYYSLTGYFFTYMTVTVGPSESAGPGLQQHHTDDHLRHRSTRRSALGPDPPTPRAADRGNHERCVRGAGIPARRTGQPDRRNHQPRIAGPQPRHVLRPGRSRVRRTVPARTRYTGASISYNLAFTIFGGTAPLLSIYLIETSGNRIAPASYVVAVSLAALVMIARMPETSTKSCIPTRPTHERP